MEALLLRHFPETEHLRPATSDLALEALRSIWPDYRKGMAATELRDRLDAVAVARAAASEPALRAFLDFIDPGFLRAGQRPR